MPRPFELKVKQFAEREGVTERTVWNWIGKGAVKVRRTPGGGIRILTLEEDRAGSPITKTNEAR